MEISVKPLNKGQVYPCRIQTLKKLFKDTPINFVFTHGENSFNKGLQHPLYKYVNKSIKGKVVIYGVFSNNKTYIPVCSICALKETECSTRLISEMENEILSKFLKVYLEIINDDIINQRYILIIELLENHYIIHKHKISAY